MTIKLKLNMKDSKMLLLGVLLILVRFVAANIDEDSDVTVLKRTLPAYAVLLDADILNSTQCRKELNELRLAVNRGTLWARKVLDSSGSSKPGFIYGNNYWFGSKVHCLDASNHYPFELSRKVLLNNSKYRNPEEEVAPFEVNYFVARFRHNSTLQYHIQLSNEDLVMLGLCLPASCTSVEIGQVLTKIFREKTLLAGNLYSADFKLVEVTDLQDDHQWLLTGRMIIIICVLIVICVLLLLGTLYDILIYQKIGKVKARLKNTDASDQTVVPKDIEENHVARSEQNVIGKFLLCFSIYTNTKFLLDTKLSSDSIRDIHGMRFLGIIWIMIGHSAFFVTDFLDNKIYITRFAEQPYLQVFNNGVMCVDTFFFLSGFLLMYLYIRSQKNKEKSKPLIHKLSDFFFVLLYRFIRLTPAYMLMIGIAELNFGWLEKISPFSVSNSYCELCQKYWWQNILYINNFFNIHKTCVLWTWYMAADMQFFIVGNILIIISSICFAAGAIILCTLLIFSIAITGYLAYIYEYELTLDDRYNQVDQVYTRPWVRMNPYLIGMATAYILHILNNKLPLKKRTVFICWCLSGFCCFVAIFGTFNKRIPIALSSANTAFDKTMWGLGLAWVLIAVRTNHGGFIHRLLSYKGWIFFSRLSFCTYLMNPIYILSTSLFSETPFHVDIMPLWTTAIGNVVGSFSCGYVLSLMIEVPCANIMKQFVTKKK